MSNEFTFGKLNVLAPDARAAVDYACGVLGAELAVGLHVTPLGHIAVVSLAGLALEIIQPLAGSTLERIMEKRGSGIHSVGFSAAHPGDVAEMLKLRGATVLQPGGPGLGSTAWLHPKNPLSLSIEFYPPSNGPAE